MQDDNTFVIGGRVFESEVIPIEHLPLYHYQPGSKVLVFREAAKAQKRKRKDAREAYQIVAFPYIRDLEKDISEFLINYDNKHQVLLVAEDPSEYFSNRFLEQIEAYLLVLPLKDNAFARMKSIKKAHVELVIRDELLPKSKPFLLEFFKDIRATIGDVPLHTSLPVDFSFVYNHAKDNQNTYCPKCNKILIGRSEFGILVKKVHDGACVCGNSIYGNF